MSYRLQAETINRVMNVNVAEKKYRNNRQDKVYLLPFPTRNPERAQFKNGFMPIVAGALRKLQNISIDSIEEQSFDDVLAQLDFKDAIAERFFEHYIESERAIVSSGTVQDVSQLTAVPLSENANEVKGEKYLIHFVHDVFLHPYREEFLKGIQSLEPNNIIFQLFRDEETDSKKGSQILYAPKLKRLGEQFKKDFLLLLEHPSFLVQNIELLFAQYTFIAISQLILQVSRMEQFNEEDWVPIYFFYQEEKSARWRDAYKWGYRMVRNELKNFYAHEHLLNIVSQAESIEQNAYYHDIQQAVEAAGPEAVKEYIQSAEEWMKTVYCVIEESGRPFESSETIGELYREMYEQVKINIPEEVNSRYPKGFEELFNRFYYKHGGSLGKLNGLDQRQVMLLVAVSVGTERLELNLLWDEFEKRGIFVDYKTKEVIVDLLDSLNYIEKKSDSGDAQYVKPIL